MLSAIITDIVITAEVIADVVITDIVITYIVISDAVNSDSVITIGMACEVVHPQQHRGARISLHLEFNPH